jgi:hypothetical protein
MKEEGWWENERRMRAEVQEENRKRKIEKEVKKESYIGSEGEGGSPNKGRVGGREEGVKRW